MSGKCCPRCHCRRDRQPCDICHGNGFMCKGTCACCQEYRNNRAGRREQAAANASVHAGISGRPNISQQASRSVSAVGLPSSSAVPGSANIDINKPSTSGTQPVIRPGFVGAPNPLWYPPQRPPVFIRPSSTIRNVPARIPPPDPTAVRRIFLRLTETGDWRISGTITIPATELADVEQTSNQPVEIAENLPSTSSSDPTGTPSTSAFSRPIIRRIPTIAEIGGVEDQQQRLFCNRGHYVEEVERYIYFCNKVGEMRLVMCGMYFITSKCLNCQGVRQWAEHWRFYDGGQCHCGNPRFVTPGSLHVFDPEVNPPTSWKVKKLKSKRLLITGDHIDILPPNNENESRDCEAIEVEIRVRCRRCLGAYGRRLSRHESVIFTCHECGRNARLPFIHRLQIPASARMPPLSREAGTSTTADVDSREEDTDSEADTENSEPSLSEPDTRKVIDIAEFIPHAVTAKVRLSEDEHSALVNMRRARTQPVGSDESSEPRLPERGGHKDIDITAFIPHATRAKVRLSHDEYSALLNMRRARSQPVDSENLPSTSAAPPIGTPGTSGYRGVIRHMPTFDEIRGVREERLFKERRGHLVELRRYKYHFDENDELRWVACGLFYRLNYCFTCGRLRNWIFYHYGWRGPICKCPKPHLPKRSSMHILPANSDLSAFGSREVEVLKPARVILDDSEVRVAPADDESPPIEYEPIEYIPNIRCEYCTSQPNRNIRDGYMTFPCCECNYVAMVPFITEPQSPGPASSSSVRSAAGPSTSADTDMRGHYMAPEAMRQNLPSRLPVPGPSAGPSRLQSAISPPWPGQVMQLAISPHWGGQVLQLVISPPWPGQLQQPVVGPPWPGQLQQPVVGPPWPGQLQQPVVGPPWPGQLQQPVVGPPWPGQLQQPVVGQPWPGQLQLPVVSQPGPDGVPEERDQPVYDIQNPAKRARTYTQRGSTSASYATSGETPSRDDSQSEEVKDTTPSKPQRKRESPFESPAKYQRLNLPSTSVAPSTSGVPVAPGTMQRFPLGGFSLVQSPVVRPASIIRTTVPVGPSIPVVTNIQRTIKEEFQCDEYVQTPPPSVSHSEQQPTDMETVSVLQSPRPTHASPPSTAGGPPTSAEGDRSENLSPRPARESTPSSAEGPSTSAEADSGEHVDED